MGYFGRRLAHALLVLVGVSLLSFLFLAMAPGEFFSDMKVDPQISPETVAALRAQYGLDRPLPVRYIRWLGSVLRGDLGFSFAYNMPASGLLWERARNTLLLTGSAALLSWAIAIPLGVWVAAQRGRWANRLFGAGTSTLLAVPDLMLALALLVLAIRTRAFPTGGMISPQFEELGFTGKLQDLLSHFALPVLAIILGTLPMLLRHVRASMVETLDAPFMQAARAHGLPRRWLLFRYGLRAAANPLISLAGFSVATLLSASLLVEVVMSWPGLGPMLLEAIMARDIHLVIGAVIFSTLFLVTGNLLADMLLYWADPRIRAEQP